LCQYLIIWNWILLQSGQMLGIMTVAGITSMRMQSSSESGRVAFHLSICCGVE